MRINKSDIQEQLIYIWECPECHMINNEIEDPDETEYYHCIFCNQDIELQDD